MLRRNFLSALTHPHEEGPGAVLRSSREFQLTRVITCVAVTLDVVNLSLLISVRALTHYLFLRLLCVDVMCTRTAQMDNHCSRVLKIQLLFIWKN